MGVEDLGRAMVEAERVHADARDVPVGEQPLDRVRAKAREMLLPVRADVEVIGGAVHAGVPARVHGDDGARGIRP